MRRVRMATRDELVTAVLERYGRASRAERGRTDAGEVTLRDKRLCCPEHLSKEWFAFDRAGGKASSLALLWSRERVN